MEESLSQFVSGVLTTWLSLYRPSPDFRNMVVEKDSKNLFGDFALFVRMRLTSGGDFK